MESVSLIRLFGVFARIGAFTIGGGYAMIPILSREMTDRGWMEEKEVDDLIVLAQSAPGILAVNMAIYTGHRLRGIKGSIVATIGAILPSFLAIIVIAMALSSIKDSEIVRRIFQGVRPAVIALILVPAVRMAERSNGKTWWSWAITAASIFLVAFLNVSPIWIIITIIAGATAIVRIREGRRK